MIVTLTTALMCSPMAIDVDYAASEMTHTHQMGLLPAERDKIRRECELAIQKMYGCLNQAEDRAWQIVNIDVRSATVGAIEGAIAGLSGRTPYTVIMGGLLGALARIGGDAYIHFEIARDLVKSAQRYAEIADELQERLWRDE